MAEQWYVHVVAATTDMRGRRRRWSRVFRNENGSLAKMIRKYGKVQDYIEQHLPAMFHGDSVVIVTPLHRDTGTVNPDTRKWEYC